MRSAFHPICTAVLSTVSGLFLATQACAGTLSIVDIDAQNAISSSGVITYAYALNDAGQVVGFRNEKLGSSILKRAFLTGANGQSIQSIGALGAIAYGVNSFGQVVGAYGGTSPYAFVTGTNGASPQNLFSPNLPSVAVGINDAGQVAGYYKTSVNSTNLNAFVVRSSGSVTNLDSTPNVIVSDSAATAINQSGVVVGNDSSALMPRSNIAHPTDSLMTPLGIANRTGARDNVLAINDAGIVAGWYGLSHRAYVYNTVTDSFSSLGTLAGESEAFGINNQGVVVGRSQASNGLWHAFVWGLGGSTMIDLNTLVDLPTGVYLEDARDINNVGQIVANGSDGRAYLISSVPEPATVYLALIGLAFVSMVIRKQRMTR